ncbi:MAG: DUF5018 domain-containing protein [Bacteroidales bacterium]|jgi:hypothetical protein|nr:DUF5018 domain-containing protein [Bacteroidales bacterium]MCI2122092.1 DUF5018 domain-containing protein [Bacteroidales bacterium]MCI2145767.1 DUF5018 domain-containing protein [Bacteroidales bacterium]
MKKFYFYLAAIAAIVITASCNPDPVLTLTSSSDSNLEFDVRGETKTVTFNANYDWTATSSESWVSVSPASGTSDAASVTLTADENTGLTDRSATVTISMEDLNLVIECRQIGPDFSISDESTYYEINQLGGEIDVNISSNIDYTYSTDDESSSWLTFSKGTVDSKIAVDVAYNDWGCYREGSVYVKHNSITDTLTVGQIADVWNAKLSDYVDISNASQITTAELGDYFIVSPGDGTAPVLINKSTQEKSGTLSVGDISVGSIKNDDAGNLLIANRVIYDTETTWWNDNFKVYKMGAVDGTPVQIIDLTPAMPVGAKIEVRGDVNGNAVITASTEAIDGISYSNIVYYWVIKDGAVESENQLELTGFTGVSWAGSGYWFTYPDQGPVFAPISSNVNDGFVFSCYDEDVIYWVNPVTGACTAIAQPQSDGNAWGYAYNALEIRDANGVPYAAMLGGTFFNYFYGELYVAPVSTLTNALGSTIDAISVFSPEFTTNLSDGEDAYGFGSDLSMCAADGYLYFYTVQKNTNTIECFAMPL